MGEGGEARKLERSESERGETETRSEEKEGEREGCLVFNRS